MVIALSPEEIPVVTEALELAQRVDCIPRSGRPGDLPTAASDSVAGTSFNRRSPYIEPVVDIIQGSRRSLQLVPEQSLPSVASGPQQSGS